MKLKIENSINNSNKVFKTILVRKETFHLI